ncbi:histidine kinase [Cytophagaceae bacterium AH-315-L13]|nr:histidine kinase [Cytophagaceae bacterium AH-315-L13]
MYKFIIVVCLSAFLLSNNCFAGGAKKEIYLKNRIETKTLAELKAIEKAIESSPEESIKQLDGIIRYSINRDLKQSISYAYLLMGRAYKELQQPQLALHFMELVDQSYSKLDVQSQEKPVEYYLDLAEIHVQLGDYSKSNNYYRTYQSIINDDSEVDKINYSIAQNYYAMEEFNDAINIYEELLEAEKEATDEFNIRVCYSRLAACYISLDNTEKGLALYKLSMSGVSSHAQETDQKIFSQSKEIVTKALRKQNKYQEELSIRNEALNIINDGLEHLRLAQTYFQSNNLSKTESSLDQYFQNISYDLIDQNEIQVIKQMAILLKSQYKNEKALEYLLRYEELSDTIKMRLSILDQRIKEVGSLGYQNVLTIEVLQKDKEISENAIDHLMRESELKEDIVGFQKSIIYLLCVVIFLGITALIYIVRVSKQRRIANQQLALRSLRSQMNPHFIFNALNSVNSFISVSDERSANQFLTEFSTLMRTVMENSEHDFIPLAKELEIIKIYAELEHFRFKDKFSYQLKVDANLEEEEFVLPPMLIQPYIENAIWHGLRYKETIGELIISFQRENKTLKVMVQDDGIGREKSAEIKTKNQKKSKSIALKNIGERVELFNSLHKIKINVSIKNLNEDASGTIVTILIPQPNNG